MTVINEGIVSDADDGFDYEYFSGWYDNYLRVVNGHEFASDKVMGFRFQSVAVPQGATINSATLTLDTDDEDPETNVGRLFGNDVDSAPAWASTTNLPRNITRTAAFVALTSVPTTDETAYPLDVTAIVQEIVDRAGWSSGNNMAFAGGVTGNTGARNFEDYGSDPADAAALSIDYTEPVVEFFLEGETGALEYDGGAATLSASFALGGEAGALAYDAGAAALLRDLVLSGEAGALEYAAGEAAFFFGQTLSGEAGALVYSAGAASLTVDWVLSGEAGALEYAGGDAGLLRALLLDGEGAALEYAAGEATLNRGWTLAGESGALAYEAGDAALLRALRLAGEAGALDYAGGEATLTYGYRLSGEAGALAYQGGAAALLPTFALLGETGELVYAAGAFQEPGPSDPRAYNRVHLLEATPFDPSVSETISAVPAPFGDWAFGGDPAFSYTDGGGEPLFLTDGYFNSLPSDDPANRHYEERLLQAFNFEVRLFEGLEPTGRASQGFGDIVIWNGDGFLDSVLDLGWSGRPLALYRAQSRRARSAAELVFQGTVDGLEPDEVTVSLRLRDRQALLERPFQSTLYAGSGGAEGGDDLAGKRKPRGLGRLFNTPWPLIDAANLVYQGNDGQIEAVQAVRDKGVALTASGSDRADYAALIGATIASGEYDTCLAEGLIRLGGAPDGQITVDFHGDDDGSSPGGFVETAGTIIRRIVTSYLDTVNLTDPDDLDTASFSALETDQPAPIGFWSGPDSTLTVGQVLDQIMASIGGWWFFTNQGLLSLGILTAPSGTAAETISRDDILLTPPLRVSSGVPSWRRYVGYQRNWAPQDPGGLAGSVSAGDRQLYGDEYRFAISTSSGVLAQHRGARDVVTRGLFALEADATTEVGRLQTLHGTLRRLIAVALRREDPFDAPLGEVVEIQGFNRLTLSSSKKFICVGAAVDLARDEVTWFLWG